MLPDLTPYWHHQVSKFALLASRPHPRPLIALLGDSITEGFLAGEFLPHYHFANRGISGDVSEGVLLRLKESVLDLAPEVVLLLIGTNDLAFGYSDEQIMGNIEQICSRIRQANPKTRIVLQSILPTRGDATRPNERIRAINARLKAFAEREGMAFLDLHPAFADARGELLVEFSFDGLHLNGPGYAKWAELLAGMMLRL